MRKISIRPILCRSSIFLLFVFCCTAAQAQIPPSDTLWKEYVKALKEDIRYQEVLERQRRLEEKRVYIQGEIESAAQTLTHAYSDVSVQQSIKTLGRLAKDRELSDQNKKDISTLHNFISDYKFQAGRFIKMCHIDSIDDPMFNILVKKDKSRLIPSQIQSMVTVFKKQYEEHGLSSLVFDTQYGYLNQKLNEFIGLLRTLESQELSAEEMFSRLVDLLKIESQISDNHKTYYIIK